MRVSSLLIVLNLSLFSIAQVFDTTFFPEFVPYSQEPILEYGDGIASSPWNDPTILKEGDQYMMYISGVEGGILFTDELATYRWVSDDGYSWTLSPNTPVLVAEAGTFYEGGVETPSVVKHNGVYHMYNTCYTENVPSDFKISHATSDDGLTWVVDADPFFAPAGDNWNDEIVAEPGAMIKDDTIFVFFTAIGSVGTQTIGLAKTMDGSTILDTMNLVSIPRDVYPQEELYVGLSTPSATMVGDTIYLFTDVAQTVLGRWTQVALHQFKSYGNLSKWYYDPHPIHVMEDFDWTHGNYLSEIRSITPLWDGDKLRIWYAGNHLADVNTSTNDTTYHVYFEDGIMHANPGKWGIGTSEFDFRSVVSSSSGIQSVLEEDELDVKYIEGGVMVHSLSYPVDVRVYTLSGEELVHTKFDQKGAVQIDYSGGVVVQLQNKEKVCRERMWLAKQ